MRVRVGARARGRASAVPNYTFAPKRDEHKGSWLGVGGGATPDRLRARGRAP